MYIYIYMYVCMIIKVILIVVVVVVVVVLVPAKRHTMINASRPPAAAPATEIINMSKL